MPSRDDSGIDMIVGRHSFRLVVMSGDLADLPLNCPKCGRPMRYLHVRAADGRIIDVATATDADVLSTGAQSTARSTSAAIFR